MVWTEPATRVSYIYVFEEATVMDEGIRPAYIHAPAQTPHLPDSYHFRPPIGEKSQSKSALTFAGTLSFYLLSKF